MKKIKNIISIILFFPTLLTMWLVLWGGRKYFKRGQICVWE